LVVKTILAVMEVKLSIRTLLTLNASTLFI
jgi:hypothetical protein